MHKIINEYQIAICEVEGQKTKSLSHARLVNQFNKYCTGSLVCAETTLVLSSEVASSLLEFCFVSLSHFPLCRFLT